MLLALIFVFKIIDIRKLAGSLIYHLIGDSKELAKYVFDKFCKKAVSQGLNAQLGASDGLQEIQA